MSGTLRTKKGALYSIFHMAVRVKTFRGHSELPSSWENFYTGLLSYLFSLLIHSKELLFPITVLLKQTKDKFNSNLNNTNSNRSSTTSWGRNFMLLPKMFSQVPSLGNWLSLAFCRFIFFSVQDQIFQALYVQPGWKHRTIK